MKVFLLLMMSMASLPNFRMVACCVPAAFSNAARKNNIWSSSKRHRHCWARHTAIPYNAQLLAPTWPQCRMCLGNEREISKRRSTTSFTSLFLADGGETTDHETRTTFNIPVLKKETTRLAFRALKKIGKVATRIRAVEDQYSKLNEAIDANSSEEMEDKLLQQLEDAPSVAVYKEQMEELQARLQKLNWLEEQFGKPTWKNKKMLSAEDIELLSDGERVVQIIQELDISDDEEQKQKRIDENSRNRATKAAKTATLKQQNQRQGARLPYRRYYTEAQVEIRVGKQATDNDLLSLSPDHRSGAHWWFHAAGCAGSHVVLCTDAATPSEEDVLDAAALAALKSKCIGQSVIKVSMTRARNVSKPPGAAPGLVRLSGDVKTVTLRKTEVEKRCKRLEETVVVN